MIKPFCIAEIGINHNGNLDIANKLILESKISGFDAVKFQKRDIDIVYSKETLETPRESPWGNTTEQQKRGLEFGQNEYEKINDLCKSEKIEWFASAWDKNSLLFLKQFNLTYNKVASPMIVDLDFLENISKQKKHTFISTGMSTKKNIDDAVEIFRKNKCSFELMHCVSTYPMKPEDANLVTINSLKSEYNCDVGYSGHENGVVISILALAFGISSLERHVTLDRDMYGSDQLASLEPRGMRELISGIRKAKKAIGKNSLGLILEEEKLIANKLRSHLKI